MRGYIVSESSFRLSIDTNKILVSNVSINYFQIYSRTCESISIILADCPIKLAKPSYVSFVTSNSEKNNF